MIAPIKLYTPIPPMKTGTATYIAKLLDAIRGQLGFIDDICIISDLVEFSCTSVSDFQGIPVYDYRSVSVVSRPLDLTFFFIANNIYHGFVHQVVEKYQDAKDSRCISVIHEPSNCMLITELARYGKKGFSSQSLRKALEVQYGPDAEWLIDAHRRSNTPKVYDFVSNCQYGVYRKSCEIWTHSVYAAEKLLVEYLSDPAEVPKMRVFCHPRTNYESVPDLCELESSLQKKPDRFRIGMFGWVSEPKRVLEAIEALSLALDRLPRENHEQIELLIVGQLPSPAIYDPVGRAESLGVDPNLILVNFVDNSTFELLFRTCDCILNLRFPSAGETSGTISLAHSAGVKVIKTEYQAFCEEQATVEIYAYPFFEVAILASSIVNLYKEWREDKSKFDKMQLYQESLVHSHGTQIEQAVVLEILKNRLLRRGIGA